MLDPSLRSFGLAPVGMQRGVHAASRECGERQIFMWADRASTMLCVSTVPTTLADYDDNLNTDETAIQELSHDVDHLRAADAYLESAMNRRGPQGAPGPVGAAGKPGADAQEDGDKTPGPPGPPGPPGATYAWQASHSLLM